MTDKREQPENRNSGGESVGGARLPEPRIPVSTYRLQFNRGFTFRDAERIIPFLHELGITDVYASPYFKAKPGSLHGYDIVDHNTLNPEIGTGEDYSAMTEELSRHGMGQILDIVPNHMSIDNPENAWWMDILENGSSSPYAPYFDIDWDPIKKELKDKVLLPLLGDQYGVVLENQELKLCFGDGAFFIAYYEHRLPVRPQTYILVLEHRMGGLKEHLPAEAPELAELLSIITALRHLPPYTETHPGRVAERLREKEVIKRRLLNLYVSAPAVQEFIDGNVRLFNGVKGEPGSFNLLDNLLREQVYRLSHWRTATEEINYRRFFDINSLGSIRMENPEVFRETHRLVFELIGSGKVTGLRVDHPDGLYNPVEYFHRLQRGCFIQQIISSGQGSLDVSPERNRELAELYDRVALADPAYKPFYIVGEKILTKGERMPEDWPIFSTTGYVFLNSVNGIFIDGTSAKPFDNIYEKFIRSKVNFQDVVYEKKKLVMQVAMSSEVNALGHYLNDISEKNRHTRDFTLNSLTRAIVEVIAVFPVYRTYTNTWVVTDRDRQVVELAVSKSKRKNPALSESIFDFLKDVLLLRFPQAFSDEDKGEWLDFVLRFQQVSGPVMAKGVEDTAFYVYNRLASLNEVGGMPDRFGVPLETFHGQNIERAKSWPHALITTSTHDCKRDEDVRARINVLSEIPREWGDRIRKWARMNKKKKEFIDGREAPDRNEEYLLYQTLTGAWPAKPPEGSAYDVFARRIKDYMLKALREAKVNTSWINPNAGYENAILSFIDAVIRPTLENAFLQDFLPFQRMVSHYGMYNSLSQMLLKIASPGVPDFYQGMQTWNFSLVDPDNRRPVEYPVLTAMLDEIKRRERDMPPAEFAHSLTADMGSGMIKLFLMHKALNYRKKNRELFEEGEYVPIEVAGSRSNHVCSFARRAGIRIVIAAVPRYFTKLIRQHEGVPLGTEVWGDSFIAVPFADLGARYANIFTGEVATAYEKEGTIALALADVFRNFPVSLMERIE